MTTNAAKEIDFLRKSLQERTKTLERYSGSLLKTSMALRAKNQSFSKALTYHHDDGTTTDVQPSTGPNAKNFELTRTGAHVLSPKPPAEPPKPAEPPQTVGSDTNVIPNKPPVTDHVAGLEPHIPPKESPIDNAVYPEIHTHPNRLAIRATLNGHVDAQRTAMKAKSADGSYVTPHGELLHHLDQQRSLLMMNEHDYESNLVANYIHEIAGNSKSLPANFTDFTKNLFEASGAYGPSSKDQARKLGEDRAGLLQKIVETHKAEGTSDLEKNVLAHLHAKLKHESHASSVNDFKTNYLEQPHAELQADREKTMQQIKIEDEYKKKSSRMLWDQLQKHLKSGNSLETFKGDYSKLGMDPKVKHSEQNFEEAASNMGKMLWMNHRISAIGAHEDNPHSSAEFWTKRGFLGGVMGGNGPEGEDYLRNAVADKLRGHDPNANVKLFPLANTQYGISQRVPQSQLEQEFLDQKGKQWASMAKKRFGANMQRWREAQSEKKEAVGELKTLKDDPSQSEILGSSGMNSEISRLQQRISEAEKKQVAFGNILAEDRHHELTSESDHFDPFFLDAIRRRHTSKQVGIHRGFHGSMDSDTRYQMAHDLENTAAINKRNSQQAALAAAQMRQSDDPPERAARNDTNRVEPQAGVVEPQAGVVEPQAGVVAPVVKNDHLNVANSAVRRASMHDWKGDPSIAGGVSLSSENVEAAQTSTSLDDHKKVFDGVMDQVLRDDSLAKITKMVGKQGVADLCRRVILRSSGEASTAVEREAQKTRVNAIPDPLNYLIRMATGDASDPKTMKRIDQASELVQEHLKGTFIASIKNTNNQKVMYHFLQKIGVQGIPSSVLPESGKQIDHETHFAGRIEDKAFQEQSIDPEFDGQFTEWKNKLPATETDNSQQAFTTTLMENDDAANKFLNNLIDKHVNRGKDLGRLIGPDFYDYMTSHPSSGAAMSNFQNYGNFFRAKNGGNFSPGILKAFREYLRTKLSSTPAEATPASFAAL